MRKSKLLFILLVIVFFIIMLIIAIDFSSRTSFPGQNKVPAEQTSNDSTSND